MHWPFINNNFLNAKSLILVIFIFCSYFTSILLFSTRNVSKDPCSIKPGWQTMSFWEMVHKKHRNMEKYALSYLFLSVTDSRTGFILIYFSFKNQHLLFLHLLRESKKRQGGWGQGWGQSQKWSRSPLPPLPCIPWTIFRGSPVLRNRPDKDKEGRDGGVDRHSWGLEASMISKKGWGWEQEVKKGDVCRQLRAGQRH